jgi:DNA modification methylase
VAVRILSGDCRDVLRTLPADSIHMCITSPPYYGLRDYGVEGQLGLEETPEAYIAEMIAVFREVHRVLRPDGTLWLNIGDSYSAHAGQRKTTDKAGIKQQSNTASIGAPSRCADNCKPKDLIGIPWMLALALRADGWWLRQDIIWSKPNPMPESVTDRCTKAHEYLFLMTKSERYYYDAEAIKEDSITNDPRRPYTSEGAWALDGRPVEQRHGGKPRTAGNKSHKYVDAYDASETEEHRYKAGLMKVADVPWASRNKRSVWSIATQPYSGAHYATFPPALVEPCILAGTSEKGVCPRCGAPWERQTKTDYLNPGNRTTNGPRSLANRDFTAGFEVRLEKQVETLGWSASCACNSGEPVPATVLDCFGGSGTSALVADRLHRSAILIELNPKDVEMARNRLIGDAGMFADVAG